MSSKEKKIINKYKHGMTGAISHNAGLVFVVLWGSRTDLD